MRMVLRENPLVIAEAGDVCILGSVHTLRDNVPRILREIENHSPDTIFIELNDPSQATGSKDVEAIRRLCRGRLECVDRPLEISSARYYSGTPPDVFFKETIVKYLFLPLNIISNMAYNAIPRIYKKATVGGFYTFGWSEYDTRIYIFERDEYMAGKAIGILKDDRNKCQRKRYIFLSGRRHVPGISSIIEAYEITGDVGCYYAGGKVYDVFSLDKLSEPYYLDHEKSQDNFIKNRLIEKAVAAVVLPGLALALFIFLTAAFLGIAMMLAAILH